MTNRNFENSTVLITGGAGFIGSNFVHLFLRHHTSVKLINFDKLTYAGNLENLDSIKDDPKYKFVRGDISSREDVEKVFAQHKIDCVVNFAAESHVDRSIHDVSPFIETNIQGTVNLIETANSHWKDSKKDKLFLHVSTDEVYGSLGTTGKFTEETPLNPKNPYSASKAASDMMVKAFVNTHDFPALITRCSNNYGPYQFPEKLIPLTILNIMNGKSIPVYGDGMQVRDWIYVEDHCSGIETAMKRGKVGEVYNFGGEAETANINLVKELCSACDRYGVSKNAERLITFVKDRPGHDRRYAMDISRVRSELDWNPKHSLRSALTDTCRWYIENKKWWELLLSGEYMEYYQKQYG